MASKHSTNKRFDKTKLKLSLYGKLTYKAVAYCNLHKCYLEPIQIKEKSCNFKKCKYLRQIRK